MPLNQGDLDSVKIPRAIYGCALEFVTPTAAEAALALALVALNMEVGLDYLLPCDKLAN